MEAANDLGIDLIEHLPYLRSLAARLCGRSDEAADLVQEVVERGLRWAPRLPERKNLRSWLKRVLCNLFIDGWRRRSRDCSERVFDLDALPANDDQGPPPRWAHIDDAAFRLAVDALAPEFRVVYRLHAEGHDYDTIASRLRLPKATVGTRLHRARKKLRVLLEKVSA
jgi:RNA polymerase sigma-70 factor (ECF subfamily)